MTTLADTETERLVLGAVLVAPDGYSRASEVVATEDFTVQKHRYIWEAMRELHRRGDPIDRITLAACLEGRGQLKAVDGLGYLAELDQGMPATVNLEAYGKLLRRLTARRQVSLAVNVAAERVASLDEDPQDVISSTIEKLLSAADTLSQRSEMYVPSQVIDGAGGINEFLNPAVHRMGLRTGFTTLDEMTGGLRPGELVVVAGRPSQGKTAFGLNVAQFVALGKARTGVAVFSLEMSKESLVSRMICSVARVDSHRFRCGYMNADERRRLSLAASRVTEAPIFIDENSSTTLLDMHSKLRRLKMKTNLGLVVVDYLQLIGPGRQKFENRNQELESMTRGLKALAKEFQVPVMVLSQLSRAVELRTGSHRPQLSDLRGSGGIEQESDLVLLIYREELYKPDREDSKGKAELIVAKQRNGPTGTVKLAFLKEFTKFENYTTDTETGKC